MLLSIFDADDRPQNNPGSEMQMQVRQLYIFCFLRLFYKINMPWCKCNKHKINVYIMLINCCSFLEHVGCIRIGILEHERLVDLGLTVTVMLSMLRWGTNEGLLFSLRWYGDSFSKVPSILGYPTLPWPSFHSWVGRDLIITGTVGDYVQIVTLFYNRRCCSIDRKSVV